VVLTGKGSPVEREVPLFKGRIPFPLNRSIYKRSLIDLPISWSLKRREIPKYPRPMEYEKSI
jgi:hypothetical protein